MSPRRLWATQLLSIALVSTLSFRARAADGLSVQVPASAELAVAPFVPPDLSKTSPAVRLAWFEARGTKDVGLVTTCLALEATGWVDEAEPIAFERIAAMAAAAVIRARGSAPAWHLAESSAPIEAGTRRRELAPEEGDVAEASLFLGFVGQGGHEAIACFAVSFGVGRPPARHARFVGPFTSEPSPGLGLRALVASIHHPRLVFVGGGAVSLLCAVIYLRKRPRPRLRRRPLRDDALIPSTRTSRPMLEGPRDA